MDDTRLIDRVRMQGLTIDGVDSLDLDDAFWLEVVEEGYILHISIADVGAEISAGSSLDQAAYKQCFTHYMRHQNKPMLDDANEEHSAEKKLSLLAHEERLSLTISLVIDSSGDIQAPIIRKSVLTSQAKLSYEQADAIMADADHRWHTMLKQCQTLSKVLFKRRCNNGAIALYDLQQGFSVSEEGMIQQLNHDENYHSHILIQEFMILVNEVLARFFAEHDIPALYRNHTSKAVAPERSSLLKDVNDAIALGDSNRIDTLIKKFALIFNKAEYSPLIKGHYALNLPAYLHMTSPIRRYADLVNIRQLSAFISKQVLPYTQDELLEIAAHINAVTLKYKKGQAQHFKKIEFQKRQKLLQQHEFSSQKDQHFRAILSTAAATNQLPSHLDTEIQQRLQNAKLDLRDQFIILFQSPDTETWQGLKSQLLHQLGQDLPHATSLLVMAVQKLSWQAIHYATSQVDMFPPQFFTIASTQIKQRMFASCSQKSLSLGISNKKTSQQLANLSLLANILDIPLDINAAYSAQRLKTTVSEETEAPLDRAIRPQPTINYIGKLMELYQQKGWDAPSYEYTQEGAAHLPQFMMQASILIDDQVYTSEQKQNSHKKTVKQSVSADLIEKIAHLPAKKTASVSASAKSNFVGMLNTLCQQRHLDLPYYHFDQVEAQGLGQFKCLCCLVDQQQDRHETFAYSRAKKVAKQQAAQAMWQLLNSS